MDKLLKRDNRISVASPNLSHVEKHALIDAFDSGWISSRGKYVEEFEQKFANFINTKFAVSCSSGTTALHLALLAAHIGHGDEVIVPDLTFVAVPNSVLYCGATPIICDINRDNYTLDIKSVKKAITPKTKAIIAVHLYGNVCDMDKLSDICRDKNIILIEDCAESFGSKYKRKHTGSIGDISIFSLFANKTITTGEGGMVCTNNHALKTRIEGFRNHCTHPGYVHTGLGYNYRMTNLQAAIGCAQLSRTKEFINKKKEIARWYASGLDDKFKNRPIKRSNVPWMYTILVNNRRDEFMGYMDTYNIETKPMFAPTSSLPYLCSMNYPEAAWVSRRGVCLPTGTTLTREEVDYVCKVANSFRGV